MYQFPTVKVLKKLNSIDDYLEWIQSREMTEPSMQLWTDHTNNEFAILLNSKYVIRTSQNANYTKMIDESPCMQGYTYDWKHTLSHWVNYHYGNQVVVNISDTSTVHNLEPGSEVIQTSKKPNSKSTATRLHLTYFKPSRPKTESKTKLKLKPEVLKCHYCNLKYFLEEERKEHEKFWHTTN
jgi:hypothetical protein